MSSLPQISVLFMGPFNSWGARERGLIREAKQAKLLGLNVIICCPLDSYIHVEARKYGLETFPIRPAKPGRWFGAYRDVFNFLHKRHRLTHFHCYDSASIFSAALFLRRYPEVALVWSIHGTPPTLAGNWWQRLLLSRTDRFLLPSSLSLARLSRQLGVSAHKIARVGLAIDQREIILERPDNIDGFIVGASLPDSEQALATTDVAVRALALVHARGLEQVRLLLHTPRDWSASIWREGLEALIDKLGMSESVEFVSGEDFSTFVSRLHLSLAPEGEEVPYDQIEVSMLGVVPVIHPRNRAYRDLLHDIEAGLYSYKPSDARELAEKLLKLHNGWSECSTAMHPLRDKHAKWHDPERVREKLMQVYERTILRRRKHWRKFIQALN